MRCRRCCHSRQTPWLPLPPGCPCLGPGCRHRRPPLARGASNTVQRQGPAATASTGCPLRRLLLLLRWPPHPRGPHGSQQVAAAEDDGLDAAAAGRAPGPSPIWQPRCLSGRRLVAARQGLSPLLPCAVAQGIQRRPCLAGPTHASHPTAGRPLRLFACLRPSPVAPPAAA